MGRNYTIVLFSLLLFSISSAQYSENLWSSNPGFELYTGTWDDGTNDVFTTWISDATAPSFIDATSTAHSGNSALKIYYETNYPTIRSTYAHASRLIGKTLRLKCWSRGDGTYSLNIRLRDITNSIDRIVEYTGQTDVNYALYTKSITLAANTANLLLYLRGSSTSTSTVYVDDVEGRLKIDTLYIDPARADETDDDSTKTLTEAFVTRGAHSGGTFITTAGTYNESITIDSSFTLWATATAGTGTYVTAVDFNDKAATLLDVYVTTPTNDSNITYTYTPTATTTRKRNFGNYSGWGGW